MKKLLLFLLAGLPFVIVAEDFAQTRLAGILKVGGRTVAILEDPSFASSSDRQRLMIGGQRDGNIELIRIQVESGTVQIRPAAKGDLRTLKLNAAGCLTNQAVEGLVLEDVGMRTVLKLLGEFSDRTVLQHPSLPNVEISLNRSVTNRAGAAQALKDALLEKQIAVVPDGEKFLAAASQEKISTLTLRSAQLPKTAGDELIPSGSLVFTSAHIANVVMIYAEFLGGELDRGSPLPPTSGSNDRIFLFMQNALTKEECSYALETSLRWHGIKLVPTETGLFKAVSTD